MVMRTHPEGTCPAGGSNVECRANCNNPFRECREDALRYAELEMILDGKWSEFAGESREDFINRLAAMIESGAMTMREARAFVGRTVPPRIFELGATQEQLQEVADEINRTATRSFVVSPILVADKVIEDLAPVQHFDFAHIAPAVDSPLVERLVEQMREDGYEPDLLIHGEPMHTIRATAGEEVRRGDAVVIDQDGVARRAEGNPIGVALGDGLVRLGGAFRGMADAVGRFADAGMVGSGGGYGTISYAMPMGSMVGRASRFEIDRRPRGRTRDEPRYQYNERFPKEVEAKAMELLRKFMSPEQYTAFVDKANVELENKAKTHRLIINQNGSFKLLKGGQGAGIEMTSGSCRGYKYPLGDEIAAFLDWFRHRTEKLIENWECGNFGIIEKNEGIDEGR